MEREPALDRALEELENAQEAIHAFQDSNNITALRRAYEAATLSRNLIGTHIKEVKTIAERN